MSSKSMVHRTLPALFLLSVIAFAQAPLGDRAVLVMGAGNLSCGTWLEEKSDTTSLRTQWLLGYLTGYNGFNANRQVQVPDAASAMAFVHQYCANNPLHNVLLAANALVDELGGIKAKHQWKR